MVIRGDQVLQRVSSDGHGLHPYPRSFQPGAQRMVSTQSVLLSPWVHLKPLR